MAYGTYPLATSAFPKSIAAAMWHNCLAFRTRRALAILTLEMVFILQSFHQLPRMQIACNFIFALLALLARCAAAYAACGAIRSCTLWVRAIFTQCPLVGIFSIV